VCGAGRRILRRRGRLCQSRRDLGGVERSEQAQQIGDALQPADAPRRVEPLGLAFELRDDGGVEQLAHLDLAEQLAQQGGVDRQRRRAALGEGESPSYMNAPT
jgi:hypothetical protein